MFSPRVAVLLKPQEDHTFRLSFNRAYRSPSVINNFLNVRIFEPLNLGVFNPALNGREVHDESGAYPLEAEAVEA